MSLSSLLSSLDREIARHARTFDAVRANRQLLAPYPTALDLRRALDPASSLPIDERRKLVAALVDEVQRTAAPLWSSLLLAAFAPMLLRLRTRLGRPRDEDLDSAVVAAFLGATRAVRGGPFAPIAIRWATEKEVHAFVRKERRERAAVPFEDELHGFTALDDGPRARALEEVLRVLEAEGAGELLDVLVATRGRDESLRAYVVRTGAEATPEERSARYERLCRARLRFERELRARLAPRAA